MTSKKIMARMGKTRIGGRKRRVVTIDRQLFIQINVAFGGDEIISLLAYGGTHHVPDDVKACSEHNFGCRIIGLVRIRPKRRKRLRPQFAALSVAQRALHLSVVFQLT